MSPRNYPGRSAAEAALRPVIEPLAKRYAGSKVQRLLGFWVCFHSWGGSIDALVDSGLWSVSGIYAQRQQFREVFGVPVEEFMPEVGAMFHPPKEKSTRGSA